MHFLARVSARGNKFVAALPPDFVFYYVYQLCSDSSTPQTLIDKYILQIAKRFLMQIVIEDIEARPADFLSTVFDIKFNSFNGYGFSFYLHKYLLVMLLPRTIESLTIISRSCQILISPAN